MPALVLTDLIMPEMNGLELVKAIREHHPFVPVILMTSKGNEEIAVQALQGGAASYVPKSQLAETCSTLSTACSMRRDRAKGKLGC